MRMNENKEQKEVVVDGIEEEVKDKKTLPTILPSK